MFDIHSGKTTILQEHTNKVDTKAVDRVGGFVRNFHHGITGKNDFNNRLMNYFNSKDDSVTAYPTT